MKKHKRTYHEFVYYAIDKWFRDKNEKGYDKLFLRKQDWRFIKKSAEINYMRQHDPAYMKQT